MTTPGWLALTASARGASHVAMDTPNQDAVATGEAGRGGIVAAVADGHGHWRHLRSARGSQIAVAVGCAVGAEVAGRIEDLLDSERAVPRDAAPGGTEIAGLVREFAVPEIISRWRAAVLADLAADPFSEAEQDQRLRGDDPTIAYGSTLLLALALRGWLVLAQIGDGDVVGVRSDGRADLPIPVDPQLDGLVTTSLCGPDPASDFRVAVVDTANVPLIAVLLATDGYGNAQVIDEWPDAFSKDLAGLLRHRDQGWLAEQLPIWTARCASSDGSADDTTVALLLAMSGRAGSVTMPPGDAGLPAAQDDGSEETTIPAIHRGDTVPSAQVPAEPGSAGSAEPAEPVTVRQAVVTSLAAGAPQSEGEAETVEWIAPARQEAGDP